MAKDRTMSDNQKITVYPELIDAVVKAVTTCDPATREVLAGTIAAYKRDFPQDFYWATGPQAPAILRDLMMEIFVAACCVPSPSESSNLEGNVIQFPSRQ
jgi:hypothetical protein